MIIRKIKYLSYKTNNIYKEKKVIRLHPIGTDDPDTDQTPL